MKKANLLIIVLFYTCSLSAQSYSIGHTSLSFTDASRSNRSITAEVYYPSNTAGNNTAVAAGQYPVVVFGHGFVIAYSAYNDVWNAIVPSGYIMVFPTTETSFSPSHLDFGKDIAFLVSAMKAANTNSSSLFFGAVTNASAVMGHSMGGGSAFLAVQYDSSITALASFAPAVTTPSSITAAKSIYIPAIVFAGANDCVAPPAQNQQPMYDSLSSSCKTFVSITGGSHCQFANYSFNCTFGESTCTPQPAISAALQQTTALNLLLPWLNFYLKKNCASGTQFQNLIAAGSGITSQQNCVLPITGPVITVNGGTAICQGDSVVLTASSANSYLWSGTETTQSITVSAAGNYSVTVSNAIGCSAVSAVSAITVNTPPSIPAVTSNGPVVFCQGDSVRLTSSTANSYLWSSTETAQSITVFASGNYSVTVSGTNGCSAVSAATAVIVNQLPPIPVITANGTTLTSSAAAGNQWFLNGAAITNEVSQSYTALQNGSYTVSETINGCSSSSAPYVNITSGIKHADANNIVLIIPNPSNGKFRIECAGMHLVKIKIYNLIGQIIYEPELPDSEIDLSAHPKGAYFIEVQTMGKIYNKKLILE